MNVVNVNNVVYVLRANYIIGYNWDDEGLYQDYTAFWCKATH